MYIYIGEGESKRKGREREILKEFAHAIMGTGKSETHRAGQWAGDLGES